MASEFTENTAGIEAMLASREMSDAMVERAERGKAYAMSISPVDTGRYKYGQFVLNNRTDPGGHRRRKAGGRFEALPEDDRGGFEVTRITTAEGHAGARLINSTRYARWIEWGTRYMAAQHVLGQSLDAMR